jgi:hypothetical protein
VRDGRLTEADADLVQTPEIRVRQIGIALPDVIDRLIHPVSLIILCGLEHTAAVHVTEQFVTGTIKKLLVRQITLHSTSCVSAPSARRNKFVPSA